MSEILHEDVWSVVISFSDIFSIYKLIPTSKKIYQLKSTIDFQILLNFYFSKLLIKHNQNKKKIQQELLETQGNMVKQMNQFHLEFIIPLRSSKIVSPKDLKELIPINS
jgi:hypothetical protein